jgi:ATP synthase delta (OSCP) subunit
MENIDLSSFFTTKSEAGFFSSRLSAISEKIYQTNFDLEKTLTEELGMQKKEKFLSLLKENNIATGSNSGLKNFIAQLINNISKLPVLALTIPFEPNERSLQTFSQWFLLNINKQVLFVINVDPDLIAGAVIKYKGKFVNLSIRPQFDQIVQNLMSKPNHTTHPFQSILPPQKESNPTPPIINTS